MIHKGVTAMTNRMFGNSQILAWLQYYSDNTQIDLEKVKILDITRKNKNLGPNHSDFGQNGQVSRPQ